MDGVIGVCALMPDRLWFQTYLSGAHADRLFAHNPGDALQQRWCGQRTIVGPVVQGSREQGSGVEIGKRGLLSLRAKEKRKEKVKTSGRKVTLEVKINKENKEKLKRRPIN